MHGIITVVYLCIFYMWKINSVIKITKFTQFWFYFRTFVKSKIVKNVD